MAEAILRKEAGDLVDVESAGSEPAGYVHPKAIQVMGELGLDALGTAQSVWRHSWNERYLRSLRSAEMLTKPVRCSLAW